MKKVIVVASAIALSGCVSMKAQQVESGATTAYAGAPLTVVTYKKPAFSAMTYGRAMLGAFGAVGGAVGGLANISAGNEIIQQNEVPDPAHDIAARVAPVLAARLKTSAITTLADQDDSDEKKLSAASGNKGLVLDIQTLNWMFLYFPLDWTHYHVMYTARARLIDASSAKVIGQVPCTYDSGDDKTPAPNYDTLLADHAAVLKAKLATAQADCIQKIESGMLAG
jgi:hypothetical protein